MLTNEVLDAIVRASWEAVQANNLSPEAAETTAELVKMARRYAWLRDGVMVDGEINDSLYVAVDSASWIGKWALTGEDLDAAIDQAIAESKQE
ncbi:hypothetical protein CAL26_04945 [Bordetella genomosp. 9]|uniref:Uncharacterized protein n=1 Tax=Bordetella genomosp. 9 TaxID=1416803 RepID=A0A261RP37_9BORD|nr:hypothetical protein [Bordetella genomosp. 9]OZI26671.1 hypothetical protein CAL26_04945 [Bordetella genomosp. 9]